MPERITPADARRAQLAAEPIHGMIYFTPFRDAAYAQIGIAHPRTGYFASRSAPLGQVPAEVVIATFFNFNPALVRRAIPSVWQVTTPERVLAARLAAADQSLRAAWADDVTGAVVQEAAALARRAAESVTGQLHGRPLFAAHTTLPWPDEPHLVLWHAQTLLREYRGDAHVALLLTEGLDGLGALITHAATGAIPAEALRTSRAWTQPEWDAGVARLQTEGWLAEGPDLTLTESGRARRQRIEQRTDELAAGAYDAIGADGTALLTELATALSARVMVPELGFRTQLATRYAKTG
jgi:hypothetical protein